MSIRINLGYSVHDYSSGLETENIPLEYFKYNILISGKDQIEKSALLSHILNQLYTRASNTGVLLIKLNSNEDTHLYQLDKEYEYGNQDLEIPYFFGKALSEVNREHFECIINAIFGFHFEMKIVMGIVLKQYRIGNFPNSIVNFLTDVKNYLIKKPYSEDFNESNVRSIEKEIDFIQENPILERTLWMYLDTPRWVRLWKEGKKVSIDFSECDLHHQKVLIPLLFQVIKEYMPLRNSNLPVGIIVLEDADNLLNKPPHWDYKRNYNINRKYYQECEQESYFLTKEQLEKVYGDRDYLNNVQLEEVFTDLVLDELNDRSISFITTCEDPFRIYDHFRYHSQIRINITE